MKTTLKQYKVRDIVDGFVYNEYEGKIIHQQLRITIKNGKLCLKLTG